MPGTFERVQNNENAAVEVLKYFENRENTERAAFTLDKCNIELQNTKYNCLRHFTRQH